MHEISVPAFEAAGDPARYPDAGDPWQPSKLYYSGFSFRRIRALHDAYEQMGEESPYAERLAQLTAAGGPTDLDIVPPTTFVDVGDHLAARRAALLAHRTQIDPESHWMRVPDDLMRSDVPVGGVRARPRRWSRRYPSRPTTTRRRICSPGCASPETSREEAEV